MDVAAYCADQVRRYDHDRYLCALFAPAPARAHVLALYAFNLEVARIRETAREPMMGLIRLQWWREVIDGATGDDQRRHPVALALAEAIRARGLARETFERLLTGREFDMSEEPPPDLAALEAYAETTSSSLVGLTLDVLGARTAPAAEAGRHVGIAWALIGLLRAVPFHARQRRVYLPVDLMRAEGIETHLLFEGHFSDGLRSVARAVGGRAAQHLDAARVRRRNIPRVAVPALLLATLADIHLKRLERAGFSLFDSRLQRPAGDRAMRLAWAALRNRY